MTEETDNKIIITETIVEEIEDNMIMIITETTDNKETTETTKEDNRTETTLEITEENNHKENQHLSMLGIWTSILMNRL